VNSRSVDGETASAPALSIITCTYNEAGNVGPLVREITAALGTMVWELIVVDDNSPDGTAETARAFATVDPRIRVIQRMEVRGLASAAVAGFNAARADTMVLLDADLQHDPAHIPALVAALPGKDLVAACRVLDGEEEGLSAPRTALSRTANWLVQTLLGAKLSDPMTGYFAMTRSFYEGAKQRLSAVGFKILVDLLASSSTKPRIGEVAMRMRVRGEGRSKLDARVMADLAALVVDKRSGGLIPARFVLFGFVGASGIIVQVGVFAALQRAGVAVPEIAQAIAILIAMTSNYILNNMLTFRDRRLTGSGFVRGWFAFALGCAIGSVANLSVFSVLHRSLVSDIVASALGAIVGSVSNYILAQRLTWRTPKQT